MSDSRRLTAANIYDKALFQIRKRCQHGNVTIAVSCDQHRAGIAVGWSHIGFDAIDFPLLDRLFVLGIKLCNKFLSIYETETIYFICKPNPSTGSQANASTISSKEAEQT